MSIDNTYDAIVRQSLGGDDESWHRIPLDAEIDQLVGNTGTEPEGADQFASVELEEEEPLGRLRKETGRFDDPNSDLRDAIGIDITPIETINRIW